MQIQSMVERLINLHHSGNPVTLLAVCPNSAAVLEAAVITAKRNRTPILLAATLNQIDLDGGYTGWTPAAFVAQLKHITQRHDVPLAWLIPCLDHGGPWAKDQHVRDQLDLDAAMHQTRQSITAVLDAGYRLLHIDATIDPAKSLSIAKIVERTADLIVYAEAECQRLGLAPLAYEVGTDEVHGGLTDPALIQQFLAQLQQTLQQHHVDFSKIAFVVADVGTNLHTTQFDENAARQLYQIAVPYGVLPKGHYTDWVADPGAYPDCGMGGANVGPEFTAVEYEALRELVQREVEVICHQPHLTASRFFEVLTTAIDQSNRWQKWRLPDEIDLPLFELPADRRDWILKTSARYVWADPAVVEARQQLYQNLRPVMADPHQFVVEQLVTSMQHYVSAFCLTDATLLLF